MKYGSTNELTPTDKALLDIARQLYRLPEAQRNHADDPHWSVENFENSYLVNMHVNLRSTYSSVQGDVQSYAATRSRLMAPNQLFERLARNMEHAHAHIMKHPQFYSLTPDEVKDIALPSQKLLADQLERALLKYLPPVAKGVGLN